MTASKETILQALENSMFEFPEVPGHWELPDFPGLRAHATPRISHPLSNLVGVASLGFEEVCSIDIYAWENG